MKKLSILFLMIFFAIIGLPALITLFFEGNKTDEIVKNDEKTNVGTSIRLIKVLDEESQEIMEIEFEEYIKGVVAAEMPASFELEALKAQGVAARTYAIRKMRQNNNKDKADISTDSVKGQAYLSQEKLKQKWGDNFYTYYNKISQAVDDTKGEILVYEEEPIEAVFHSTSAGITQSAKDIWQVDVPYLQSVESIGEEDSPAFMEEKKLSKEEIVEALKNKYPDIIIQDLVGQIQIIERSSGGYIKKIQIGNKIFSGEEVRNLFNLKSSCFSIKEEGDYLIFITKGYGHGAGMSQYGANYMAKEGKTYIEILKHYYKDVEIKSLEDIEGNIFKDE
ncbi:MAG: stage II sporulation protein D [Epulopiscium sp.]|nr:stage II sporulation protein D [Candidatus Epulonipiscium sp.]